MAQGSVDNPIGHADSNTIYICCMIVKLSKWEALCIFTMFECPKKDCGTRLSSVPRSLGLRSISCRCTIYYTMGLRLNIVIGQKQLLSGVA